MTLYEIDQCIKELELYKCDIDHKIQESIDSLSSLDSNIFRVNRLLGINDIETIDEYKFWYRKFKQQYTKITILEKFKHRRKIMIDNLIDNWDKKSYTYDK